MTIEDLIEKAEEAENIVSELLRNSVMHSKDRSYHSDYNFYQQKLGELSGIMDDLRKRNSRKLQKEDQEINSLFE